MKYFGAIDQGTTSSRFIVFDETGSIIKQHQQEFTQYLPNEFSVEHDPNEIWESVLNCIREVDKEFSIDQLDSIGITNQRETTLAWRKSTAEPLHNALVWQDTRTQNICDELKGLTELESNNYDFAILDDGLQDYRIKKDLSIVCFNSKQLIGNGLVIPAGPLRESLTALENADLVLINGEKNEQFEKKLLKHNRKLKIFYSYYKATNIEEFKNHNLLALAGIALFSTIASSLNQALSQPALSEATIITFLVTASDLVLFNIGSALWGIIAGVITLMVQKSANKSYSQ